MTVCPGSVVITVTITSTSVTLSHVRTASARTVSMTSVVPATRVTLARLATTVPTLKTVISAKVKGKGYKKNK